ncbi:hypothetical protein V490_00579 [Pseudogymnoascus sp. VKM F-3557]|nr:hypothetical protein V490_00579 [Pseudogymnoascus sp. VKM F-3557]
MNFHRDGAGQQQIHNGNVNYWPNRFEAIPPKKATDSDYVTYPEKLAGIRARLKAPKFKEHINQAELFYNSLPAHERAHLESAFCFELDHCDDPLVYHRLCERLTEINIDLAKNDAEMVGAPVPTKASRAAHGKKSPSLAQSYYKPEAPTIESRRVAIIISDGFDRKDFNAIMRALKAARAFPYIIGTRRSPIKPADATSESQYVLPTHHLEGLRSTMVDAIFIPNGTHIATLCKSGRALQWVREAFAHCKAVGATGKGAELVLEALGPLAGTHVKLAHHSKAEIEESYGVITASKVMPDSGRGAIDIVSEPDDFLGKFFYAISKHRIYERETDGLTSQLAY